MGFKAETVLALIHYARSCGVPTGSRVIGGATDKSDYDFVVFADGVMTICRDKDDVQLDVLKAVTNLAYACAFASLKFGDCYVGGEATEVVNLIVVQGWEDMLAWEYATRFCCDWDTSTKPKRLELFGDALRRAYRVTGSIKANYWQPIPYSHGVPVIGGMK